MESNDEGIPLQAFISWGGGHGKNKLITEKNFDQEKGQKVDSRNQTYSRAPYRGREPNSINRGDKGQRIGIGKKKRRRIESQPIVNYSRKLWPTSTNGSKTLAIV